MLSHTRKFLVLFTSVLILLLGHGLQLTLLPLRAEGLGWTVNEIGMTGSFYFLGFLVGCVVIPRFVTIVGHIRTFSTTTTLCGAALLLILLSDSPPVWCGLRFLTGVGISGCYLIIESWLNEQSTDDVRGRTLAVYTMIVLLAMSLGQLLVTVDEPTTVTPVVLGSLLLSLAIIPVGLSRVEQPGAIHELTYRFRSIYRAAPAAVGGAFAIGTVTGVLYTLTPVFGTQAGLSISEIATMMIAMVLGGATVQYPAGKLSDRFDRRRVILGLMLAGLVVCALASFLQHWPLAVIGVIFLLGGACNAVYPICLAHANDRFPGHFLEVGTVILLVNSSGAVLGPMLGAASMELLGAGGYFTYLALGMLLTFSWIAYCVRLRREAPEKAGNFVLTAKSTQGLFELDPRIEGEEPVAENVEEGSNTAVVDPAEPIDADDRSDPDKEVK